MANSDAIAPSASVPDETNPSSAYLDSCCYLDYLEGGTAHHAALVAILDAWRSGQVQIVTSALTIAEVLWVRCEPDSARMMVGRDREDDVLDLFREYGSRRLVLVELDRLIAEAARGLVWDRNIKPKDAIHVASALKARAPVLFTSDRARHRHSGQVGGNPPLRIEPHTG